MQSKEFTELKDHEIAILINALRDTALRYHDHQSLRERIARLVVPALKGEGLPKEARVKDSAENRPMPSDTVKDCIRTVFLKNGFTIKEGETDLKEYVYDAALELIASLGYRATPPAYWWINGQEDPHGEHYAVGVERSKLTLGDYTDDELADGIYLNYDRKPNMEELTSGAITPISWATAAKERIRWLSRSLTETISRLNHKTVMLGIAHEKLEALRVQYIRDGQVADKRYADLLASRVVHSTAPAVVILDGKEVPAVQSKDFEKLRNQWEDHMDNSFKRFESQLKNDWRDHIDSAFAKIEKMLLSARLHGYDAGRRVDGTNTASADEQQRPFPSRTAGEVESTNGLRAMELAGAEEVIDALAADALLAASQGAQFAKSGISERWGALTKEHRQRKGN